MSPFLLLFDIYSGNELCFIICPAIFGIIFTTFITVLFLIRSRRRYLFPTYEQVYHYYSVAIYRTFYNGLFLLGLFMVISSIIIFIPFTADEAISTNDNIGIVIATITICFGLILTCVVYSFRMYSNSIAKRFMDKSPWLRALSINNNPQVQNKKSQLIGFLKHLRILVGCICLVAILLALWGMMEIPYYLTEEEYYGHYIFGSEGFLIIFSSLKFVIAFLLLIGTYLLMINPLKRNVFWNNMLGVR